MTTDLDDRLRSYAGVLDTAVAAALDRRPRPNRPARPVRSRRPLAVAGLGLAAAATVAVAVVVTDDGERLDLTPVDSVLTTPPATTVLPGPDAEAARSLLATTGRDGRSLGDEVVVALRSDRLVWEQGVGGPAVDGRDVIGAILVDDGTASGWVVPLHAADWPYLGLPSAARSGGVVVLGGLDADARPRVARVELDTGDVVPVELPPRAAVGLPGLRAVGDRVLVALTWSWDDEEYARLAPDGTMTPLALPEPSADPFSGITVWTGDELVKLAHDDAADEEGDPALTRPWALDPATGTWRALAWPSWVPDHRWVVNAPHEGGDGAFAAWSGREIVLSDGRTGGFTGAYDPEADAWRRLDAPPIDLASPAAVAGVDGVLHLLERGGLGAPPRAFDLDVAAGTWTEVPRDVSVGGFPETIVLGGVLYLDSPDVPGAPDVARTETDAQWRLPTPDEAEAWARWTGGA